MSLKKLWFISPVLLFFLAVSASAAPILTVIRTQHDGSLTRIDINQSEFINFPAVSLRTRTDYTTGEAEFRGPLVRTVLGEAALRNATSVRMTALNDYSVDIPVEDFLRYDAILATHMNGQHLTVRDKGPIWLIYPISAHRELQNTATNAKLVWQLARIELK